MYIFIFFIELTWADDDACKIIVSGGERREIVVENGKRTLRTKILEKGIFLSHYPICLKNCICSIKLSHIVFWSSKFLDNLLGNFFLFKNLLRQIFHAKFFYAKERSETRQKPVITIF